jgi:hypothetical protein
MRAGAEGLLGGVTAGPGPQGLSSAIDAIGGAYQFRGTALQGNKKPGDYQSSPQENFFFDKRPELIDKAKQRISTLSAADKAALAYTVLTEAGPTNLGKQEVAANLLVRSAVLGNAPISAVAKQPGQYEGVKGVGRIDLESAAAGRKRFGSRYDAAMELLFGDVSAAPSSMYGGRVGQPIEYLTGDRSSANYRADHGGGNYHEHVAYRTQQERDSAMALLKANGIKIGSVNRPGDPGYHGSGLAFDVPASQVAPGMEQELSRRVRAILGIQQGAGASRAALPGVGVGTAPFDLKAQAARDKQLQRERQRAEEDLKRETLRVREQDTLRAIVDENGVTRKREELKLAAEIASAGQQATDTEQKLLELRIASKREEEILVETVKSLGPLTKEREDALARGIANKREELAIAEKLVKIEAQRQTLSALQKTQGDIQNFSAGIDAGFGVGTQASAAYVDTLNRTNDPAAAKAQANATSVLTNLQNAQQDAQSIGSSIGDGFRNALIASVTGGDIKQAFSAMFATIGNSLIQAALRPIEQSVTDAAFGLLRPNVNGQLAGIGADIAKQQEAIAATQLSAAGNVLLPASLQFQGAVAQFAAATAANGIVKTGGLGGIIGSLFSGAGPVSGAFGGAGLATDTITSLFTGGLTFASGGSPPIGQPSLVGEAGPEVSVSRGLSTIVSNGRSADLMSTLKNPQARDTGSGESGPVQISYDGPVLNFDSEEYVKKADVPRIADTIVKQGHGYTRGRLRDSPAERRAFGMR